MSPSRRRSLLDRLTRERATLVRRSWIALELGLVGAAALIVVDALQRWGWIADGGGESLRGLSAAALLAITWLITMYAFGMYHSQRFVTFGGILVQLCAVHLVGAAIVLILIALSGWPATLMLFVPLSLMLLLVERAAVMSMFWSIRRHGGQSRRLLLVGAGESARDVEAIVRRRSSLGLALVDTVPPEQLTRYSEVLDRTHPDELIFATQEIPLAALANATLEAQLRGICVRQVVGHEHRSLLGIGVGKLNGGLIVTLFSTSGRPGEVVAKRIVDIIGGSLLLLVTTPVMAITALAIGLTGGRPIYRQTRIGRYGAPFTMYKFRTMEHDADARLGDVKELNIMSPPVFKARSDPRVTKLGRFLRRWSIDELPQLVNVLKGDMSLVGPRPAQPHEAEQYEAWQKRRLCVKPGLTGPWQVAGRNQLDFADWMRLDAEYVNRWTIRRDIEILMQTVPTIISGRGAH
jgi:exopolysaccharide biosynthesis polyprenyl glycosylphosphotransferase